jgi:predicted  nucleic acid-binding Zn-ribbon protein
MARHLVTLVELQEVLVRLVDARSRHAAVPEPLAALQEENEQLTARIAELQNVISEADSEQRSAEGLATEAQQKAEHFESQTSLVTTQKEYGALLSEIDAAKQARETADESALAAIERADVSRTELETLTAQQAELAEKLAAGLAEWESERPELEAEVQGLEQRAEGLRAELPPQVATLFERLLTRHTGSPLARIIEIERPGATMWRCEACNYSVRPQVVVQVRTGNEVVLCDTCQRVFYFDD